MIYSSFFTKVFNCVQVLNISHSSCYMGLDLPTQKCKLLVHYSIRDFSCDFVSSRMVDVNFSYSQLLCNKMQYSWRSIFFICGK